MTNYLREPDVDTPFLSSQVISNSAPIYPDFWRGQPLDDQPLIDPRKAGFRPYVQYPVMSVNRPFQPYCAVSQRSCDIILPVNKCYNEAPQEWLATIFEGR